MKLVFLGRDLMLSSRVEGAAQNLGFSVSHAADVAGAITALSNDECRLVFVDLQLPGLDIVALVEGVRKIEDAEVLIVACGPHVHEQRLNEARQAGCDRVVTRGQFDRDANSILQA
ncbi:MAG: hypothetical protein GXP26_02445 [Planctomycetes bacterium]|nr:hypothetical protein [Planctomycetota bacterium]